MKRVRNWERTWAREAAKSKAREKLVGETRTERPRALVFGEYTATVVREQATPWGPQTTWSIMRAGRVVGQMFQGGGGYGDRPSCSLSKLVWAGALPPGCSDSRSENYGMCFDVGPCDTREAALEAFARQADRLIAWREEHAKEEMP